MNAMRNTGIFYGIILPATYFIALILYLTLPPVAWSQRLIENPKDLEGIGITENLDKSIAMDAAFKDDTGKDVRIGEYFKGDVPTIVTIGYYRCPMLCPMVQKGLVDGLKGVDLSVGDELQVVSVSIDPKDTPSDAVAMKKLNINSYDRPGAEDGWHFLTGTEENIRAVADSIGFGYEWDEESQQYKHAAAIFVLTPEGKISRYIYGLDFAPATMKMALLEAGKGQIGTVMDRILLFCYHYDSDAGQYTPFAINIARLGGGATLLFAGILLGILWLAKPRQKRNEPQTETPIHG